MKLLSRLYWLALALVLGLAGCTGVHGPDGSGGRADPYAFDRAPPRPADYDHTTPTSDFAGLSNFNYPGAPAPTISPEPPAMDPNNRLQTLDVLSVGLSVEMFRQGDVWKQVQKATNFYTSVLPPPESKLYQHSDDPGVWEKRQDDALELVLKPMVEAWPVPTVTIYRARKEELSERMTKILWNSVDNMRMPAGLHWTQIHQLEVVYNDTPEEAVEAVFRTFERYPDLPAMLVYVKGPSGQYEDGKRVRNAPIATYAAMVVGRRERVEWLRPWAPYTKMNVDEWWPQFNGWEKTPPRAFKPTPFFPTPWTRTHFKQWDALPTLAQLHRPVFVPLTDDNGTALKRKQQAASLVAGWKTATQDASPARVFFDAGAPGAGIATLNPVLTATHSELDLTDPEDGIDLSARLGDMGAASPFVGLVLATMATAETGKPSMVVPLRRKDLATFLLLTQPDTTPGTDAFDVKLMPQLSKGQDMPRQAPPEPERDQVASVYISPEQVAESNRALNALLNSRPGSPDRI